MASNSAKVTSLLDTVIEVMLKQLKADGVCETCGAACGCKTASAQTISNILKFLDSNGFKVDPLKGGDALDELIQGMSNEKALKQPNPLLPPIIPLTN